MTMRYSYAEDPWQPATAREEIRIRLIELLPSGSFDDALETHIFWTSLSFPDVEFRALSYTWGESTLSDEISVNGKELGITNSLDVALRHLRHESEPQVLWIDQLSIDQSNDAEKTEQVSCMGDIYGAASEALVWLGQAADNSDLAMNVFNIVGNSAENWGMLEYNTSEKAHELMAIMLGVDEQHPKAESFVSLRTLALHNFDVDTIRAMAAWYRRPWFTRVWVVQEFCLARSAIFVCGQNTVKSEHVSLSKQMFNALITRPELLQHAMMDMSSFQSLLQDATAAFTAIRERRRWFNQGSGTGDSLYQLLKTLYVKSVMQATEPCDTIYSLLSLATDTAKLGIEPDYTLKSQVPVVLARAVKQIISVNKDLECLSLCQYPKKYPALPSWVPDWTSNLRYPFAWRPQEAEPLFRASLNVRLDYADVDPDLGADSDLTLALGGNVVDTITDLAPAWPAENASPATPGFSFTKYASLLSDVQRMCTIAAQRSNHLLPDIPIGRQAEAVWRVPIGDIEQNAATTAFRATTEQANVHAACLKQIEFQRLQTPVPAVDIAAMTAEMEAFKWATSQYYARMDAMQHKRSFVTKHGLVGMAPAHAEVGDEVVLLYGADLPYVMRELGTNTWELVGESYCDGIMDGEALDVNSSRIFLIK